MNSINVHRVLLGPKTNLQDPPLTSEDRFHPSRLDTAPVCAVKAVICAPNVTLHAFPPPRPSRPSPPLSGRHVPDPLHSSY